MHSMNFTRCVWLFVISGALSHLLFTRPCSQYACLTEKETAALVSLAEIQQS